MLGVPAGQGGEKSDRSDRSDRPKPGPRPEKREEKKGPLVVVRRTSGAVETRTIDEGKSKPAVAEDAPSAAEASPAPAKSETPVVVAKPAPLGPSVADAVPEAESFAEMFEAAGKDGLPTRKQLRVGEK